MMQGKTQSKKHGLAKRLAGVLAIVLIPAGVVSPAFAQDAVIQEIRGKVETRIGTGEWTAAAEGQVIPVGATISTGFGAQALLEVGDASITVQPLTRLTIEELVREQGTQRTDLFLGVGRVRADVRTGEDTTHDFKVRSAVSTAAVRGTSLVYDGYSVTGLVGLIVFESNEGFLQLVGQGDQTTLDTGERPTSPRTIKRQISNPDPTPNVPTETRERLRKEALVPVALWFEKQQARESADLGPDATVGVLIAWPE